MIISDRGKIFTVLVYYHFRRFNRFTLVDLDKVNNLYYRVFHPLNSKTQLIMTSQTLRRHGC